MSVSKKEMDALQGMWDKAKPQSDCSVPDGVYEFLITKAEFKVTSGGAPQIVTELKVVGGNESFIGETLGQRDGLGTPENMGWFKKKLARLGITIPEDVADLTQRVPKELVGKKFAGQLKTKDEFVNVYVNKFLGEESVEGAAEEASEEEPAQEEAGQEGLKAGDAVVFTSVKGGEIEGELLELTEDGKARVKTAEGKVFRVDAAKVSAKAVEEEASEEEAEEEAPAEEEQAAGGFPTMEEAKAMKLTELKTTLKDSGMDINDIKNPRLFVCGISGYMYAEAKYMPDLATMVALRDGLKMKPVKNEKPGDMKKRIGVALHKQFEF